MTQDLEGANGPELTSLSIIDDFGVMPIPNWAAALIRLGWVHRRLAESHRRTLTVLALPTRGGVAVWVALGAVALATRLTAARKSWSAVADAPVGTPLDLLLRKSRGRSERVHVVLVANGPDPLFGGNHAVRVRVESGRNAGAIYMYDWHLWRDTVRPLKAGLPPKTEARMRDADRLLTGLAGAPAGAWMIDGLREVVVVSNRIEVLRDFHGISLRGAQGRPVEVSGIIGDHQRAIAVCPLKSVDDEAPVVILDGPRALRHLQPRDEGGAVVLLAMAEVDGVTQNMLLPWLCEDNDTLTAPELTALKFPKGWQIVHSLLR